MNEFLNNDNCNSFLMFKSNNFLRKPNDLKELFSIRAEELNVTDPYDAAADIIDQIKAYLILLKKSVGLALWTSLHTVLIL